MNGFPLATENASPAFLLTRRAVIGGMVIAFLNLLSQIILRRELAPGEFGTVNTVLGVVVVLTAPLLAFDFFPPQVPLRQGILVWGGISLVLLFTLLPLLDLPRASLQFFPVLAVGVALLAAGGANRPRWLGLLVAAALARVVTSACFAHWAPWAEAGLAAMLVAGLIVAIPALQLRSFEGTASREKNSLLPLAATASTLLAVALFTNADRIAAQSSFGTPDAANMGYIDWLRFDDYHAAGLLGRGLVWGTFPLLLIFYAQRTALGRTTVASLRFLGIYLGALIIGDLLLVLGASLWSWLFTGDSTGAGRFIPGFAGAMFMVGLLQGIGIFALASRRYPECFVFAGCGVVYTAVLFFVGRQPQVMTTCMFGGALVSLMLVLLVGVVRFARVHP